MNRTIYGVSVTKGPENWQMALSLVATLFFLGVPYWLLLGPAAVAGAVWAWRNW